MSNVSHTACSAFISDANQVEPSAPFPQYSGHTPIGSRAAVKVPAASSTSTHAKMPSRPYQTASTSPRVLYKWPMMAESDFESLTMRTPFSVVALISSWL